MVIIMKNKKEILLMVLIVFTVLLLLYFIGWLFIGGKRIKADLNNDYKERLIEKYSIEGITYDDIISFEYISFNRDSAYVLKLRKDDTVGKIINNNQHIQRKEKLKPFGFPYPNERFIPHHTEEICCFYDEKYYYLSVSSGGSDFVWGIRDLFWDQK